MNRPTPRNTTGQMIVAALVALFCVAAAGAASAGSCSASKASMSADLLSTADAAGGFTTLLAAVEAAGLEDALRGDGPLTVFAPTDEAFAALPDGTLETLLRPENRDRLVAILTYHVAPGSLTADRVVRLDRVKTLNGQRPAVEVDHGTVRLDDATVTATDIMASNGVIHVIDRVLLPEPPAGNAALELIGTAIDRGVPLFNAGQPEACTAIYEVAARGLVAGDFALDSDDRRSLERAIDRAGRTHDARRAAWIMRDALDEVAASLSHGRGMMSSRR